MAKDKRQFTRMDGEERNLELLIDGYPSSFALKNISAGGVMGETDAQLAPGTQVSIRFEWGVLVPATIKWAEDGMIGLAFSSPMPIDNSPQ